MSLGDYLKLDYSAMAERLRHFTHSDLKASQLEALADRRGSPENPHIVTKNLFGYSNVDLHQFGGKFVVELNLRLPEEVIIANDHNNKSLDSALKTALAKLLYLAENPETGWPTEKGRVFTSPPLTKHSE